MDPIRKIPKKFTKKFGNKVINRQYFRRKTGLYCPNLNSVDKKPNRPFIPIFFAGSEFISPCVLCRQYFSTRAYSP